MIFEQLDNIHIIYRQVSNIRHQIATLERLSCCLAAFFVESLEARCQVENEDAVGAAPTGDASTTSEWSRMLLPTKVRLISTVLRYINMKKTLCIFHGVQLISAFLGICVMVLCYIIMTSSNENIFRVTGHLCGEFTGHRWFPLTKASDEELWCFLWLAPDKRWSKQ